jgi:hypothetical protein
MQNAKIFPIIALLSVTAALAANHLITRLDFVRSKILSINNFPRQLGGWKAGPDLPPPPADLQKVIPTARIVAREYTNAHGESVNLTLVTATEYNDLHNPMHCMPAAGWELSAITPSKIGEDVANSVTATRGGIQVETLYWYTASTLRNDTTSERFRALRTIGGGTHGHSLLVRLITAKSPRSKELLVQFAKDIQKPLDALKEEARTR